MSEIRMISRATRATKRDTPARRLFGARFAPVTSMLRLITFSVLLLACSKKSEPPSAGSGESQPPPSAAPVEAAQTPAEEARATFNTVCAACHGPNGTGDGVASASLNPKPRNYTDKAWQASVTDEQIKQIILQGGAAVGKSPLMPPNPQLKDKPQVIDELAKIVRSFGK